MASKYGMRKYGANAYETGTVRLIASFSFHFSMVGQLRRGIWINEIVPDGPWIRQGS